MSNLITRLKLTVDVGEALTRPGHGISSLSQLARKLRVSDDLIRRNLDELEIVLGQSLVSTKSNRLSLSPLGREFTNRAKLLCRLAEGDHQPDAERLVVEIDEELGNAILPTVLGDFLRDWPNIEIRIFPLQSGRVKENVQSGLTTIAIECTVDQNGGQNSGLATPFGWGMIGLPSTSFPEVPHEFDPESLAGSRLFLPTKSHHLAGLESIIYRIPIRDRIEIYSESLIRSLVQAGFGLGLVSCWNSQSMAIGTESIPIMPLPSLCKQQVIFHLPKESLSEAATAFRDAVCRRISSPTSKISQESADSSILVSETI